MSLICEIKIVYVIERTENVERQKVEMQSGFKSTRHVLLRFSKSYGLSREQGAERY